MIKPAVHNLSVVKGDCLKLSFRVRDGDDQVVDLTGWGAVFAVSAPGATWELTDASGLTLGGAAGTIEGEFAEAVTELWPVGRGPVQYQLALIAPGDTCRQTYVRGPIEVSFSPKEA